VTRALICGTFDPVTLGHADIIGRAAGIFDEVVVCEFVNSEKKTLFTAEQRLEMLRITARQYKNVLCDASPSMTADYVREKGIDVIVKGIRNVSDYDYETMISGVNAALNPRAQTLFMPCAGKYAHICSTTVREMLKYNVSLRGWVPDEVADYIAVLRV